MRLLLTRPRADSERLAAELAGRGVASLIEPMLSIRRSRRQAPPLASVQALIFTSRNGVGAWCRLSGRRDLTVFAVGDASAEAARSAGFRRILSAAGAVRDLVPLVAAQADPGAGELVHATGRDVAGDVAGDLAAMGFAVRTVILYRAVARTRLTERCRRALAQGRLDGVVFFSARTARIFAGLIRAQGTKKDCRPLTAYCMSRRAADAARALPFHRVLAAHHPTSAAMIDLIERETKRKP